MQAEYDGRQIVGIDLHRRRSVIVRMTEAGDKLDTVRIDNDPVALGLEIAKAGPDPEVVLEATYGWYWAADVLTAASLARIGPATAPISKSTASISRHSEATRPRYAPSKGARDSSSRPPTPNRSDTPMCTPCLANTACTDAVRI